MNAVLIVGCGDIGRRVAQRCRAAGSKVTGLVRSSASAEPLDALGVPPLVVDLDSELPTLPTTNAHVYYFAPPPPTGDRDTRIEAFLAGIEPGSSPSRLVYISTSAVYGDCDGEWIDESAPLQPDSARGQRRLAAERALLQWGQISQVPVVILRVPGIYGPGRLPLERLRKGVPLLKEALCPFTNRIHAEDLADICLAAMTRGRPGAAYNVSDGHPSNMVDYFNRIADRAGLPHPPTLDRAEAERQLSAGMLRYMRESKRLKNDRMLDELGITLRYPELGVGLESCFVDSGTDAAS